MTTTCDKSSTPQTKQITTNINPNAKYVVSNDTINNTKNTTTSKQSPEESKQEPIKTKNPQKCTKDTKIPQKTKEITKKKKSKNSPPKTREEHRARIKADARAQEKADDEEIAKFYGKKSKNGTGKKSNSSYYLYHSTSKEEAEKYKPQKVSSIDHCPNKNYNKSASAWNTGATMEEFDYSDWAKDRITDLLLSTPMSNAYDIHFSEMVKIEGSATVLYTRGKFRPGYDFMFEVKWNGNINGKEVNGTLHMNEITSEDDSEDWEFEVKIKKKTKGNKNGAKIISQNRENVINSLQVFISELKAKKC